MVKVMDLFAIDSISKSEPEKGLNFHECLDKCI